jgi:hypothetical protein
VQNVWRFFSTTYWLSFTTRLCWISGRARPTRRLPTLHIRPVRGPAPGLPPGRPQTRVLPSPHLGAPLAVPRKDRKGAYSHTLSAGFLGTHAGSDESYVLVCESRSVKLWGLCTGAAARGREVPLSEVHQTETRRKSPEIVHFEGRGRHFPGAGGGTCAAALNNTIQ